MAQFYSANRRVATRERVTVSCDQMDAFGQGLARHRGKVMFIPGLLPGEQVEVRLTEDKRQYSRGEVIRRLNDPLSGSRPAVRIMACAAAVSSISASRCSSVPRPRCWLSFIAREQPGAVPDVAQIGSSAYCYRRRTRLGLVYRPKGCHLSMGYRQAKSSELVDIHACPILRPELEQLIAPLRACLEGLRAVAHLGHVELAAADNGPLVVVRHLQPLGEEDRRRLLDCLRGEPPFYRIAALTLRFSPRDFIQINDEVNRQMVA
ncbi:23S rRNA (uracil(1939)-C(5))-methyltransferase RlmD [Sodalis glossinidius str. 'morsitans']|uniref:23S rRNA (Uracil(1939)-C(5))-methyltransferase RlmD n=1 Tax=Sodalis glossinidius (strain morsitans) TaxID=343509 RepID=Q2NVP1_SODGM|nr:putative RNA methyltransferase [Sodalis glossinidius str. 'morsitans']CRL44224.1 23S rRNA (uracil(1939)-C(5))-methyltransferase RlmD [Sodalis glossinidius str. 'morsitans']